MSTFAELFCNRHQLAPDKFEQRMFWGALPWRIRLVAPLVMILNREYFAPEREFIRDIGNMRKAVDFRWVVADYRSDPANRKFPRRQLRIRASVSRARDLVRTVPEFISENTVA